MNDLIEKLRDDDPVVRAMAVHEIGQQHDDSAIGSLVWLMGDDSLWVRCNAAEALGEFRNEAVIEPLVAFLRLGCDMEVQLAGQPEQVPIRFHTFIRQDDPAYLKWANQQDIILRPLGFNLAVSAKMGLQMVGISATDTLIDLLADENPYVQYVAVQVLNQMAMQKQPGEALMLAMMRDDALLRQNAVRASAKLGNQRVLRAVSSLLYDEVTNVRLAAIEALSEIRDRRAKDALIGVLDDEPEVHQAALLALYRLEATNEDDEKTPGDDALSDDF